MADPIDPTAMRGARSTPLAAWVIAKAANAVNGIRHAFGTSQAPAQGTALALRPNPPQGSSSSGALMPSYSHPLPGTAMTAQRREPWFGPGSAPVPTAPRQDVAGRAFDYIPGVNMGGKPRQYSGVSFDQLRGMADALDVARLCIETRKDQMGRLTWSVLPKQAAGQAKRPGMADDRCRSLEAFLQRPDRKHGWDQWQRMIIEDQLVIDAVSVYVRKTAGGDVYSLDVIDGTLIKPLLDVTGRAPDPPQAAFQQVLKGMPAVDYTSDELLYAPRNPRSNHIYGLSVVEQIIMTINIAIRREIVKLNYFTEGNVPEALVSVPKDWAPEQISRFQVMWDALLKAQENRAGLKFVPGDMQFQATRSDGMLQGPFDEWVARVICFAFSLPPTAFVQQQNRATAETASDTALEEGLAPMMVWFKAFMDRIIQDTFGYADLEFTFDDVKQIDVAKERAQDSSDISQGVLSIDEVRAKRGLDPLGIGNTIPGGPNGLMFISDLIAAQKAGLTAIQPPPQPPATDAFGNPVQTAGLAPPPTIDELGNPVPPPAAGAPALLSGPAPVAAPQPAPPAPGAAIANSAQPVPPPRRPGADPLAGIPAGLLAAVGLGPQGASGRSQDVTRADEAASDPAMAHVGHAQILATLRGAEDRQAARSAAMHKRARARSPR